MLSSVPRVIGSWTIRHEDCIHIGVIMYTTVYTQCFKRYIHYAPMLRSFFLKEKEKKLFACSYSSFVLFVVVCLLIFLFCSVCCCLPAHIPLLFCLLLFVCSYSSFVQFVVVCLLIFLFCSVCCCLSAHIPLLFRLLLFVCSYSSFVPFVFVQPLPARVLQNLLFGEVTCQK